jgi:hypothetical protein
LEQNGIFDIQIRTEQENEKFKRHIKNAIFDLDLAIQDITYNSDESLNMSCRKVLNDCLDKVQKLEEYLNNGCLEISKPVFVPINGYTLEYFFDRTNRGNIFIETPLVYNDDEEEFLEKLVEEKTITEHLAKHIIRITKRSRWS